MANSDNSYPTNQRTNTHVVGPGRKTGITHDMCLCSLKLHIPKPDLLSNVVLRIAEFHTVLRTLRTTSSLIEGSDIYDA